MLKQNCETKFILINCGITIYFDLLSLPQHDLPNLQHKTHCSLFPEQREKVRFGREWGRAEEELACWPRVNKKEI